MRYYCTCIFTGMLIPIMRNSRPHINNWLKFIIGCLCTLHITNKAAAQENIYREKLVNIFPNNFNREMNCLAFDNQGFIWTGTQTGLYRYDGYNADPVIFYNKDSFSISPEINDIVYRNNHIYLATTQGLFVVETEKESYDAHPVKSLYRESVVNLYDDKENGIWFLSANGHIGNLNNSQINKIQLNQSIAPNESLITSNAQFIFLRLKDNKIIVINKKQLSIAWTITFNQLLQIDGLTITPNKEIILSTNEGVFTLNNANIPNPTLIPHLEFGSNVRDIHYAENHVFINRNGANIDELINKNGNYITNNLTENKGNNLHISRLKFYNNQIIIPGRNGIGIIQINKNYFNTIKEVSNVENGDTRGITEDENYYYLCTYKNIFRLDKRTNEIIDISTKPLVTHGVYRNNDTLWLATEGNGLIRFNLKTYKYEKIIETTPEKYASLLCVKPLNRDSLIVGGYKCLFIYNKATQKIHEIKPINELNQSITNGYYRDIEVLNNQQIVVATPNGVFKIKLDGKLIKDYNKSNGNTNPENTNCFWINAKKQIWTGTSEGIVIYDSNGKFLTRLSVLNGLAGNKVASIVPDKLGNLWVGTYSGLSRVAMSDLSIKNYYTTDGLPDNEFNHASFFIDKKGEVILGTMKGFIRFQPNNIIDEKRLNSSIIVSKIERDNRGHLQNQLYTNSIPVNFVQLGKEIKYMKIYFCRLPIQFFSEINFNYKILKLIPLNVDISDKPMITLTDSDPGKHDIEITINDGSGTNGIYNKIITYQTLEYFYFNKWFYLVIVLFFMLMVIGYLYTLVIQKNKNLNIRNEIARDLHDEIGGSLTAISLYTELLREDKPPTKKQIESIQQTTRKLLISFRDALWTLNPSSDTALQLWDHIKDMVTEIANNLNIDVTYEQIDGLNDIKLTLKNKQHLLLVLKEGINNAIKHGDKKHIKLEWIVINGKQTIIITNTTHNIAINNKFTISTGIGLNSMQERMKKIGGNITYSSTPKQFQIKYHLNFLK